MRIVFLSDRDDSHRRRFAQLFASLGAPFIDVPVAGESGSVAHLGSWETTAELRGLLESEPSLVISGPLDSVTADLSGGDYLLVGISWATDVMVTAAASQQGLTRMTKTLQGLDLVLTDNYATENALISLGVDHERILRAPWGPEDTGWERSKTRADFSLPEAGVMMLYPRTLSEHYQPDVFIEALSLVVQEHPLVKGVLVESGPLVSSVKDLIASKHLEDAVVWQPLLAPEDFDGLVSVVDALVVSPKTDGTSVSVLQAMAQGVPVVSSLTQGSAEWVIEGITGWTFPVGDVVGLQGALLRFLEANTERKNQITANAKRLVSARAGWDHSASQIAQRLQKAIKTKAF
jgi:glycosyltransferase involved in cell wall biosynthesis